MIEVDFSWVGNQDVQLTMKPIPKHLGPFSPAGALLSSIIRLRVCHTLLNCKQARQTMPKNKFIAIPKAFLMQIVGYIVEFLFGNCFA